MLGPHLGSAPGAISVILAATPGIVDRKGRCPVGRCAGLEVAETFMAGKGTGAEGDRDDACAVPMRGCYWVVPGLLLAGEYPGATRVAEARKRLQSIVDAGIRTFIDLTETTEPLEPYNALLDGLVAEDPRCKHLRYAVRDASVPARTVLEKVLKTIRDEIAAGRPVYVHCWGGIGRTGTVIGCWLVEEGLTGAEALARLTALRNRTRDAWRASPETEAQRQCILTWPDEHGGSDR